MQNLHKIFVGYLQNLPFAQGQYRHSKPKQQVDSTGNDRGL